LVVWKAVSSVDATVVKMVDWWGTLKDVKWVMLRAAS
jgi:hypothetical protein